MYEIAFLILGSGAGALAFWKTVQLVIARVYDAREKTSEYKHEGEIQEGEFHQELWGQVTKMQDELSEFKDGTIADLKLEISKLGIQVVDLSEELAECRKDMMERIEKMNEDGS